MYEIERKFLLDRVPPETADVEPTDIAQGYLAIDADAEVRIRVRGDDRVLTVKRGRGEVRREISVPLTDEQFEALWPLTAGRQVEKRRWVIPQGELQLEVDVFGGHLEGLIVAEVEFPSEAASRGFVPPDWFGREVTDDAHFRNAALATSAPADVR